MLDKALVYLSVILIFALSFVTTGLMTYILAWCFDFDFSWKITLGIWVILLSLKADATSKK